MSEKASEADNPAAGNRVLRVLLGLGLMLPASICCISGMVMPTISTFNTSLQQSNGFGPGEFIGFENYSHLFSDAVFGQAVSFTSTMIVVRLLVVAIVPLLLALGVNVFGRAVRIPARLAFTIPLALYTPVALALSWGLVLSPSSGMVQEPLLGNPNTAGSTLLLTDGLFVLGLAAGLGLIIYLAALRGSGDVPPTFKQVRRPVLAAWVISLLATIALTLQAFDWSWVLTRGGPINSTATLATYQYSASFMKFNFGFGAAAAIPSLLITLLVGLIAGLIVVWTDLRLEHVPPGKPSFSGSRAVFGLILALALLCGTAGCLLNAGAIPAGLTAGSSIPARGSDLDGILPIGRSFLFNTVTVQVLFVLLLQIPLTYLAALGIGGLRPLGKRSEWLLVLFSPGLFMTAGPMIIGLYQQLRTSGILDTLPAAAGPFIISVPILFILTLFFKGCERPYHEAISGGQSPSGAFFSKVIGPSLPLTLLLALAAILVGMQQFQWPLVVLHSEDLWTMPLTLQMVAAVYETSPAIVGQAISIFVIPVFLFFLVAFGIYQVVYLERLALCGPPDSAGPQQTPPAEEQAS